MKILKLLGLTSILALATIPFVLKKYSSGETLSVSSMLRTTGFTVAVRGFTLLSALFNRRIKSQGEIEDTILLILLPSKEP